MEPLVLRPLAFGEILDHAFALYRRHFPALVAVALIPLVPQMALGLLAAATPETAATALGGLAGLVGMVGYVLAAGAATYLAGEAYLGRTPSALGAISAAGARTGSLLGAAILAGLLVGLATLALIVPGIIVYCMFFGVVPVVMLERGTAGEALTRSRQLARGALPRIFGVLLVALLIVVLPALALGVLLGAGASDYAPPVAAALAGVAEGVVTALTLPFTAAATVVLYFDRRVRAEALDVEMAAAGLAPG